MLVYGTQIHIVTFVFILLETCMAIFQLAYYSMRPRDKNRIWYLILLFLMLVYNIAGGLFPDPAIGIPVPVQEMAAYGSGFLMASFFPLYFYKAFDLKALRWHALFGVPLFLILPYVIFFVIVYAINGNLNTDIKLGMIVPLIYALVLLRKMLKSIREQYRMNKDKNAYLEEIAMYCAVTPWLSLTFFGLVEESQLTEVLCTNTGIIMISILFVRRSILKEREAYLRLQEPGRTGFQKEQFEAQCKFYRLTNREIQIVLLIREGLTYKEIAEKLFISGKTVDNHVQNIYEKTTVNNKVALFARLHI